VFFVVNFYRHDTLNAFINRTSELWLDSKDMRLVGAGVVL